MLEVELGSAASVLHIPLGFCSASCWFRLVWMQWQSLLHLLFSLCIFGWYLLLMNAHKKMRHVRCSLCGQIELMSRCLLLYPVDVVARWHRGPSNPHQPGPNAMARREKEGVSFHLLVCALQPPHANSMTFPSQRHLFCVACLQKSVEMECQGNLQLLVRYGLDLIQKLVWASKIWISPITIVKKNTIKIMASKIISWIVIMRTSWKKEMTWPFTDDSAPSMVVIVSREKSGVVGRHAFTFTKGNDWS